MNDDVLAVGALKGADGLHQRATGAGAVAGAAVVHMARVETERAVIAMVAAAGQWTDEFVTVAALEALVEGVAFAAAGVARGRFVEGHAAGTRAAVSPSGAADAVVARVASCIAAAGGITSVAAVMSVAAWLLGGVGSRFIWSIVLVFWHSLYSVYGCVGWQIGPVVRPAVETGPEGGSRRHEIRLRGLESATYTVVAMSSHLSAVAQSGQPAGALVVSCEMKVVTAAVSNWVMRSGRRPESAGTSRPARSPATARPTAGEMAKP